MNANKHKLNTILTALSASVLSLSAQAVTVTDIGLAGAQGANGGNSTADAGFTIPNTDASNSAISLGGTGGAGGAGGISSAVAAAVGNNRISALASATGGIGGGNLTITSGNGSDGGSATAHASGTSNNGGNVDVTVLQTGGAGGLGGYNGTGGKGADSVMLNAATGSTSGLLSLSQSAVGGNGGDVIIRGIGGPAGNASATLSIVDNQANTLLLTNSARGGGIGNLYNTGGNGGNANSISNGSSTINSRISITDTAIGGDGGLNPGPYYGGNNGGNANSSAIGSNNGNQSVIATSTATGGNAVGVEKGQAPGVIIYRSAGKANSFAIATSSLGNTLASATAKGGATNPWDIQGSANAQSISKGGAGSQANALATVTGISLNAQASVDGKTLGISEAVAVTGQPLPSASHRSGEATVAYGAALPLLADAQAALVGQPLVSQNFNFAGSSRALLLADMGVLNTATTTGLHSYQSSLNLSLDTTSITNPLDLLVSFLNPLFGNTGLLAGDSLIFSYSISGGTSQVSKSFTFDSSNIGNGLGFFSGRTLDLGLLSNLVNPSHILNLAFNLDLQSQAAGAGLNLGLIVGNSTFVGSSNVSISAVPLPASIWLLGSALAGLIGLNWRKSLSRA